MGYLMDRNIVSELRKDLQCNPGVARWFDAANEEDLFLSVLTLGEARMGVLGLARKGAGGAPRRPGWPGFTHGMQGESCPSPWTSWTSGPRSRSPIGSP
jgi:hypothetical protein